MIDKLPEHEHIWKECEEQLERLLAHARAVKDGDKILLVGPNASGKSMFRQLLNGPTREQKLTIVHASMRLRTESRADLGGLGVMLRDEPWNATSNSTIHSIRRSINSVVDYKYCALHIDEPEIGLSQEAEKGIVTWLKERLALVNPTITIITTHSQNVAGGFSDWQFIDLGGKYSNLRQWMTREIVPANIDELALKNDVMFAVIQTRINEKNKKRGII